MVDRNLFVDTVLDDLSPEAPAPQKRKPGAGLLDELLSRSHTSIGYRDGETYGDPAFIEHYRSQLCIEAVHLLQSALLELRSELVEARSHADQIGTLTDPYLLHAVNTRINRLVMQEERLADELIAAEEGRGRVALAIQQYRDGFIRGLKDRNEADDPRLRFGL